MDYNAHKSFILTDRSYASLIKKEIHAMAATAGFTEAKLGELDIIVAEVISNLIKHATGGGELLVKAISRNDIAGIELISIDNGPGIADIDRMMRDGSTTTGTLGQGLGAIHRLSDEMDIYSTEGWGTVMLMRKYVSSGDKYVSLPRNQFDIRAVAVPKKGETLCGDGWAFVHRGNNYRIMAVDGLGHGPEAHNAAKAAADFFVADYSSSPSECLTFMHSSIRKTRGAVGAVMYIDGNTRTLRYCGIGNIATKFVSPVNIKNFIAYNGIIGMNKPNTLHDQSVAIDHQALIILASDGLKTRWDLARYPSLTKHDLSVIAAVLYKDFSRGTDDTMIILARFKKN